MNNQRLGNLNFQTRILRDLSNQFLSELAKKTETIHYIPGDAIIKRSSKKSSIIYITYGDVEVCFFDGFFKYIFILSEYGYRRLKRTLSQR